MNWDKKVDLYAGGNDFAKSDPEDGADVVVMERQSNGLSLLLTSIGLFYTVAALSSCVSPG